MATEDPRFPKLITQLYRLTKAGRVHWTPTIDGNEPFTVDLTESSVMIRSVSRDGRSPYALFIVSSKGVPIETIRAGNGQELEQLDQLYRLARRDALEVDKVIDGILLELSKETDEK